jgi:hypothetical protein
VTKRQLNQFTDLRHLLAASANIIIADIRKVGLLLFALDWVPLCSQHVSIKI